MALTLCTQGLLLLFLGAAKAQNYAFCTDGISKPDFDDNQVVDVIFAQAPLFSTNPNIGDKLKYLSMFHSSIMFAQGAGSSRQYWTLEFDFIGGAFVTSIVPKISVDVSAPGGVSLDWNNDARFCLSPGLKWGADHWSQRFDVVTSITADQGRHAFTDFMATHNTTERSSKPQYQLWRVAKSGWFGGVGDTLVPDVTCMDGTVWFLHYLVSKQIAYMPADFKLQGTATVLRADRVVPVNMNDANQVKAMVYFFNMLGDTVAANKSIVDRLWDLLQLAVERKFVYDSNAEVYYELMGSFAPWLEFQYAEFPLRGTPWSTPSTPLSARPLTIV